MTFLISAELMNQRSFQVVFLCAFSLFSCQFIKFLGMSIKYKRVLINALFTTGGMPSSHTSTVTTLVVAMGIFQFTDSGGFDYSFAVALAISCIVIHDAMGVRFEASKHAKILNRMVENEPDDTKAELGFGKKFKLKELVGHRPLEVFYGFIYGALIAILGAILFI